MDAHIKDEDVKEFLTQEVVVKNEISEVKVEDWRVAETEVRLRARDYRGRILDFKLVKRVRCPTAVPRHSELEFSMLIGKLNISAMLKIYC